MSAQSPSEDDTSDTNEESSGGKSQLEDFMSDDFDESEVKSNRKEEIDAEGFIDHVEYDGESLYLDTEELDEDQLSTLISRYSDVRKAIRNSHDINCAFDEDLILKNGTEYLEPIGLDDIRTQHEGQLVRIDAQVQDIEKSQNNALKIGFECKDEHVTFREQERWQDELKKPMECKIDNCRLSPYDIVDDHDVFGTVMKDVQQMVLTESDKDDRNATSMTAEVDEEFINELNNRDEITAWARVMVAREDDMKMDFYLHLVGVSKQESSVELDEETIEMAEELAEQSDDIIDDLVQSVAPHLVEKTGHNLARKAVLCSLVRASEEEDGRNTFHTLLYGKKGSGKTDILEYVEEVGQTSQYVDGTQSSKAGITASAVSSDDLDSNWILESGAIPQVHGGTCCLDELDKTRLETQKSLNTPMQSSKVVVDKAAKANLPADVSIVAAMNPDGGTYGVGEPPLASLKLPDSTQSRFDIIIRVDDEVDPESDEDYEDVLKRKQKEMMRRENEGVEPPVSKEEMKQYIAYARSRQVELTDIAVDAIVEKVVELQIEINDLDVDVELSGREQGKLTKLSEAMAKLRLGSKVTVTDVQRAWDMMQEAWSGLVFEDFDFEENLFQAMALSEGDYEDSVRQATGAIKFDSDDNGIVQKERVLNSIDASEDASKMVIDLLSNEGYIEVEDEEVRIVDEDQF